MPTAAVVAVSVVMAMARASKSELDSDSTTIYIELLTHPTLNIMTSSITHTLEANIEHASQPI